MRLYHKTSLPFNTCVIYVCDHADVAFTDGQLYQKHIIPISIYLRLSRLLLDLSRQSLSHPPPMSVCARLGALKV